MRPDQLRVAPPWIRGIGWIGLFCILLGFINGLYTGKLQAAIRGQKLEALPPACTQIQSGDDARDASRASQQLGGIFGCSTVRATNPTTGRAYVYRKG